MDVTQITAVAKSLGIKLTAAEEDSEIYDCWADRVELAKAYEDDRVAAQHTGLADLFATRRDAAIAEANRYAI